MSAIFFHNDEQKQLALETRNHEATKLKSTIVTEIIPFDEFYLAEVYHQKYYLQGVPELKREFRAIYPAIRGFVNSTAAARVNGYVGGYGSPEQLAKEMNDLGLSPAGSTTLRQLVQSQRRLR